MDLKNSCIGEDFVSCCDTWAYDKCFAILISVESNFALIFVRNGSTSNDKLSFPNPDEFWTQIDVHVVLEGKTTINLKSAQDGGLSQI